MTATSIYRTRARDAELRLYYDDALERLEVSYKTKTVATRFGDTHMLVAGPEDGRPLILIHGEYESNPATLQAFLPLAHVYRVYALDIVGLSPRSVPKFLSVQDNSYGEWITDVMDSLAIDRAAFVARSYGAGILLRAAAFAPQRITAAALISPAGIISNSFYRFANELALPWARYLFSHSQHHLHDYLKSIYTELDEDSFDYMHAFLRNVRWNPENSRPATRSELKKFTAPTLISVNDDDCFFPGDQVQARAEKIFPNLTDVVHVHGKHVPSPSAMHKVNYRIIKFLETPQKI